MESLRVKSAEVAHLAEVYPALCKTDRLKVKSLH